jgi:hypothetical protein
VQGPTPATEIRDGSINAMGHVQVFEGSEDPTKHITLDPDLIYDPATGDARAMSPRACYLPVYDESTSKMRLKKAVFLAGGLHGDFEDFPTQAPTSPDYTGFDFQSLDEDGSDTNASTTWTAGSTQTKGFRLTVVRKVRYKETDGTPALKAYARTLTFDKFGRIYSLGAQFDYVIDTPVEGY